MFSEYYFYLITYVNGKEEYPAILRIDRISEIKEKIKNFYFLTTKDLKTENSENMYLLCIQDLLQK